LEQDPLVHQVVLQVPLDLLAQLGLLALDQLVLLVKLDLLVQLELSLLDQLVLLV
jgi:hypothetical protein